jgi:hypothetical protein
MDLQRAALTLRPGLQICLDVKSPRSRFVAPLRDGRLCLTSVVELAKVITPENRGEVVARFFHASKQEAKAVAAELRPAEPAPHREVVTVPRAAPAPRVAVTASGPEAVAPQAGAAPASAEAVHQPTNPSRCRRRSPCRSRTRSRSGSS